MPTKESKAEIETHPVTAEAKLSKCSIQFKVVQFRVLSSMKYLFYLYFSI